MKSVTSKFANALIHVAYLFEVIATKITSIGMNIHIKKRTEEGIKIVGLMQQMESRQEQYEEQDQPSLSDMCSGNTKE